MLVRHLRISTDTQIVIQPSLTHKHQQLDMGPCRILSSLCVIGWIVPTTRPIHKSALQSNCSVMQAFIKMMQFLTLTSKSLIFSYGHPIMASSASYTNTTLNASMICSNLSAMLPGKRFLPGSSEYGSSVGSYFFELEGMHPRAGER
jgi:hypothetical protein